MAGQQERSDNTVPPRLRPRPALAYELDTKPDRSLRSVLRGLTPGLNLLTQHYRRTWLRPDAVAGVAVAAYLIPQVMAYSAIVGVPPVASLWTALAAIVAYAVLGSSRILSSGPESTVALMTGVAIAPLAASDPDRAVALSATLALIVAGWCVLARLLRAGIIAELLSTPLLVGYLAGGAVLMVAGQLGKVTGTSFEGGTIVAEVHGFLGVAADTEWLTVAVGAGTLAVIIALRWLAPVLPAPLIAVVLATVASVVFNLDALGVAVVGEVPSGLPTPHLPDVTFDEVKLLLLAGLGITIV
ncbi:MAG: sodium-independent anion transporter, partial [Microlunatus sp.]|nr:sodium-independent anion transporter [Microlunatus sp.]